MLGRLRPHYFYILEAGMIGLFFIQALRFLIGMAYSRAAGATVLLATDPATVDRALSGIADPAVVRGELMFLVYMLALPLAALILGRIRWMTAGGAALVAIARLSMLTAPDTSSTIMASVAVGGGLFYITLLVRQRAQSLPYFFVFALVADQLFRAFGNTLDPSWSPAYLPFQAGLSALAIILAVVTAVWQHNTARGQPTVSPDYGLLPLSGGIGFGALLFLQLTLLALPNAIAGRADVDYTFFVPLVLGATVLPIVPWIRGRMGGFIGLFYGGLRGWVWMLLVALLIVFGARFQGIAAGIMLVVAQFAVSLMWWWLARPQAEKQFNLSGLWIALGVLVFALLAAADFFTYEYAFIRDLVGQLAFLNPYVPPLLRGLRGMGLGVILLGGFLAALPMTQTRLRIPWVERSRGLLPSLLAFLLVIGVGGAGAYLARPPLVTATRGVESIRVATYNIHAGANEFFDYDLEAIAESIQRSGAQVVLLQEVEAGRLTTFGVDQSLWLARRLRMDRRFFPTNEGLQGLAVLSNVPIVFDEGRLLTSAGSQTGVQRVQVSTDGVSAITVYNTWLGLLLDIPGERPLEQQEQDQQRQLNEILAVIATDHPDGILGRTIIGGTFNNVPDSPIADQMRASGFSDPFAGAALELAATFWRSNGRARLDYLWLRNLPTIGTGVIDSHASDHRLAFAEVLITRGVE